MTTLDPNLSVAADKPRRNRTSAKSAGTRMECPECGRTRVLMRPESAGLRCRRCAARFASAAAAVANMSTTIEKFDACVIRGDDGCWRWGGYHYSNGYSVITHERRQVLAHRWSYEYHVGPIPDGLQIDHLCRNRGCVNPDHLEPVTARENTRRAMRPSCVNGHLFTPENTYVPADGKRYCRTCRRERTRRYDAKRRAAS